VSVTTPVQVPGLSVDAASVSPAAVKPLIRINAVMNKRLFILNSQPLEFNDRF
jgi:hypothetical protein